MYSFDENFVREAIRNNRFDLIQEAIDAGFDDWDFLAGQAIKFNDFDLFDNTLELVPSGYRLGWNRLAEYALELGKIEFFDYILNNAPEDYDWNYNELTSAALLNEDIELLEGIINLAPNEYQLNWEILKEEALKLDNQTLFDYLRSRSMVKINEELFSLEVEIPNDMLRFYSEFLYG